MKRHLVAFDVGGSKIAVLAREPRGGRDVLADKVKTPAGGGVEAVLGVIDAQLDRLPGGRAAAAALGVAFAGRVDAGGRVLQAGNLAGWEDVPLRAILEDRYGAPAYVERDASCGALGEKWCGAAVDMEDFAFLSLGTGVGAGLFLGGRLHRGAHDAAGEAGDVAFPPGWGTVGGVLSKRVLKRTARRIFGEKLTTAEAFTRARRDERLRRATRKPVDYLAGLVIALAALLDPEAILLGGGTSEAGEALLRRLRRRIPRHLARTRLALAGLGARSPLYGALWGAGEAARAARRARNRSVTAGSSSRDRRSDRPRHGA
jgi:predicted NBD/HSP70 family sugar kinase